MRLAIIALLLCLVSFSRGQIKYSSSCAIDPCNNTVSSNGRCVAAPLCYQFKTTLNTTICAPQVACSLLDPCSSGIRCATNNSVCVINSCCSVPVCVPLALSSQCSIQSNTNTGSSQMPICANATWNTNGTLVMMSVWNYSYSFAPNDFGFDSMDNLYVFDGSSRQFFKYPANNTIGTAIAGAGNMTNFTVHKVAVDSNGRIYTYESQYSYDYMMMYSTTTYRLQRYDSNNWVNGTTMFGPTTCGSDLNSFCGCNDIAVDRQGSIYCSDSSSYRVIKVAANSMTASIVAGVTNVTGSQLNLLANPQGIYVDVNYTLYVVDVGNSRVLAFSSGNSNGRYLFYYANLYYWYTNALYVDNSGNVYVSNSYNITKWTPSTSVATAIITGSYYSVPRIRMDNGGNLYTSGYMSGGIQKYNLLSNGC